MSGSNSGFSLTVPGVVAVLAIVGVIAFDNTPLKSLRPPNPGLADQSFSDQKAPARLWQDPFEAAEHFKPQPSPGSDPAAARSTRDLTVTRILAVLVDGGPYAESAEMRLRRRHAILAALEVSGYQPVDATHIGVWRPEGAPTLPSVVPYERFERRRVADDAIEQVMILWLNSEAFNADPIRRIKSLVVQAVTQFHIGSQDGEPVVVLGPGSSDGLVGYVREVDDAARATASAPREGPALSFYSATATAACDSLITGALGSSPPAWSAQCQGPFDCEALKVRLGRYIPDDSQLAIQLHHELNARGLDTLPQCNWLSWPRMVNHGLRGVLDGSGGAGAKESTGFCGRPGSARQVVLISEWDTLYGRALPLAVKRELESGGAGRGLDRDAGTVVDGEVTTGASRRPLKIRMFTYMRGLDGNIPAVQGKDEGQKAGTGQASGSLVPLPRITPASERAEGQGQFDYLRRLAERLQRDTGDGDQRVFAIGILGSDLHDKMVILQALRPKFPATPFFTTDLDSRMLDSAYAAVTRGLIVASGFGLDPAEYDPLLRRAGAASIAPFRAGYQTAVYLAVRRAFPAPGEAADLAHPGCDAVSNVAVRLYEIGREGPVPLPALTDAPAGPGERHGSWTLTTIWFVVILVGVALMYRRGIHGFPRAHPLGALALFLLVGLSLWGIWSLLRGSLLACPLNQGAACPEPFSVLSGTSAWIPIYLTALTLVLSVLSILGQFIARARVLSEIERRYVSNAAADQGEDAAAAAPLWDNLKQDLRWLRGLPGRLYRRLGQARPGVTVETAADPAPGAADPSPQADATPDAAAEGALSLWRRHRRQVQWYRCLLYALALSFVFWLFVVSLFPIIGGAGGSAALRGPALRALAGDLRSLSMFAAFLLVFLYLDLAAGVRAFIAELSRRQVVWPAPVRAHYAAQVLRVDPSFVDRWISLRVVARYADLAVRAAVLPLLVLLLLVAARLPWFDTTALPRPVLIAVVVLGFYLLAFAWLVQRAARKVRGDALSAYREALRDLRLGADALPQRRQLRYLIERVETMHDFSFQPLAENPLLRLAILPFGTLGLGLLNLLGV